MNDFFTTILRGRKVLLGRDFYQFRQVQRNRLKLGNRFADWTFCPDIIDETSVIYSFGVGEDISFDLQLMNRFNLHIHAFDPSPNSIEWIRAQELPQEFHFYPIGLSARDGSISFSEPSDPGLSSLRMTDLASGQAALKTHSLPVNRLTTIMEKLGHNRLDILKMDIEGAEYEVVEDLLGSDIQVSQILIEFHHRFSYIGTAKTRRAIQQLNKAGFKIFDVSPSGEEMAFINSRG